MGSLFSGPLTSHYQRSAIPILDSNFVFVLDRDQTEFDAQLTLANGTYSYNKITKNRKIFVITEAWINLIQKH